MVHTMRHPSEVEVRKDLTRIGLNTKINYLRGIGLFKEEFLTSASEDKIDDLVIDAFKAKGLL